MSDLCSEKPLTFNCEGDSLIGIVHLPSAPASRGVLVVVGGPQYRVGSHRQFVLLARHLCDAGIPVLRFDYRGMGDSDGGLQDFEAVEPDIRAALAAFRATCPGLKEIVLWGLCDGATAAAFYAAKNPGTVAGLVLANPWVRTEQGLARSYVSNYYGRRVFQWSFWRRLLRGEMQILQALWSFLADIDKARDRPGAGAPAALPERFRYALESFRGRVLLILSGKDLTAGEFAVFTGEVAWKPLLERTTFRRIDLPEADHTFSRRCFQDQASSACTEWLMSW